MQAPIPGRPPRATSRLRSSAGGRRGVPGRSLLLDGIIAGSVGVVAILVAFRSMAVAAPVAVNGRRIAERAVGRTDGYLLGLTLGVIAIVAVLATIAAVALVILWRRRRPARY